MVALATLAAGCAAVEGDGALIRTPAVGLGIAELAALGDASSDELKATIARSVALVRVGNRMGAGFVVRPGLLLTAYHVTPDDGRALVTSIAGRALVGAVARRNPARDAATVTVPTDEVPALPSAPGPVAIGDVVFAVDFAGARDGGPGFGRIVEGRVEGISSDPAGRPLILTTLQLAPGNSGGPVVDPRGRVVGMVVQILGLDDGRRLSVALPIDDALAAVGLPVSATDRR